MPRIQTTRTVRFALMLLRVYLILMLVLILVYFVRNRSSLLGTRHPVASTSTAPPGATSTAPTAAVDDTGKP